MPWIMIYWCNKKVSYSHLRLFGCKDFAYVTKEQKAKLNSRAVECIFLGYGDDKFGYKLWDLKNRKLIRSRDVVFKEDQTVDDFGNEEVSQTKSQESLEKIKEPSTLTKSDEEA